MNSNMREFKNKLTNNRNKTARGEKRNNVLNIQLTNNMMVKVDRNGNKSVSNKDIEENIKEVFLMCSIMRKNQLIKLSNVCDCVFDLLFLGSSNKENSTELFFRIV